MASRKRKLFLVIGAAGALAAATAFPLWKWIQNGQIKVITGAVLTEDKDPRKQRPIVNATVTVESAGITARATSDLAGYFRIALNPPVSVGQAITLKFQHPSYTPYAMTTKASDQIHIVRLPPATHQATTQETTISNVRIRYATKSTNTVSIGSVVRTFDIVNKSNVPCQGQPPCSPDGKWKANVETMSLDTGDDKKQFRNARVSCIAGPCPFTAIHADRFSSGGRVISAAVRNWGDPVTYLMEAEVIQTMDSDLIRHTYPVTFGSLMNFTLPPPAQGPAIEAEMDGLQIVFPLGPKLKLSWAVCAQQTGAGGAKLYRCELNPGYRFKQST